MNDFRPVTMKDVAEVCGVSLQTVSCIVNGKDSLYAAGTRQKVRDAVRRLGYRTNLAAAAMARRRGVNLDASPVSSSAGLFVTVIEPQYQRYKLDYVSRILCLSDSAVDTGIRYTLDRVPEASFSPPGLAYELERIRHSRPDCLVAPAMCVAEEYIEYLLDLPFPVLFVGDFSTSPPSGVEYNQICEDTAERSEFAYRLAVRRGGRRIFMVSGNLKYNYSREIKRRCEALASETGTDFHYVEHRDGFVEGRPFDIDDLYRVRSAAVEGMPSLKDGDYVIVDQYDRPDIFARAIKDRFPDSADRLGIISIGTAAPGIIQIETDYTKLAAAIAEQIKKLCSNPDLKIGRKVLSGMIKFRALSYDEIF